MQSEKIGELAKALAATQAEIKPPSKSKTMRIPGRGDYKYADLADVIEARKVGAKHGLAITQGMETLGEGLHLTTMLMHSSGEWKSWDCPIPEGLKPQELGSFLTYMRRYSECGAWGIAAEDDDDGQAAQGAEPVKREAKEAPKNGGAIPPSDDVAAIHLAAKQAGFTTPKALAPVLQNIVGVTSAAEVPKGEVPNVIEALKSIKREEVPA